MSNNNNNNNNRNSKSQERIPPTIEKAQSTTNRSLLSKKTASQIDRNSNSNSFANKLSSFVDTSVKKTVKSSSTTTDSQIKNKPEKSQTLQEKLSSITNVKVGKTGKNSGLAESLGEDVPQKYSSKFATAYAAHDQKKFEEKHKVGRGNNFNIDILYLMDCTGSMSSWINICKQKVSQVGTTIRKNYPKCKLRQAFIGYRDYEEDGAVMTQDFVEESALENFQSFIEPIVAKGGGDTPEDIAPALKAATALSWASNTKLVLHFADAPCHGENYHDLSGDDYPDGSPTGHDPKAQLGILCQFKIDYYFVKVGGGEITEKMVKIFKDEYNSTKTKVNFMEIDASDDPEKFLPIVQTSITQSMTK